MINSNIITSFEDFEILLNETIFNVGLLIKRDHSISDITNDTFNDYLEYYQIKRGHIIKEMKDNFTIFRVVFDKDIIVNQEDLEIIQEFAKNYIQFINGSLAHYNDLKKENKIKSKKLNEIEKLIKKYKVDLDIYFREMLQDIKTSILLEYYNERIIFFKDIDFNKLVFSNWESEHFFKYLVEKWLSKDKNPKTAINYVLKRMSKNNNELHFIIDCFQTKFAEYWNNNYAGIYEFENPKIPRFKNIDEITLRYEREFNLHLSNYLNENKLGV